MLMEDVSTTKADENARVVCHHSNDKADIQERKEDSMYKRYNAEVEGTKT